MWLINKVGVRQLLRWKGCRVFNRVKYHSGLGIFGHRPRIENETGRLRSRFTAVTHGDVWQRYKHAFISIKTRVCITNGKI